MKRSFFVLDATVVGVLACVGLAFAQPEGAGWTGPIWVTDVQNRVAASGMAVGLAVRFLKLLLHVKRPLVFLGACIVLGFVATIFAMWEAHIVIEKCNALGMVAATGNVTVAILGTGEAVDLGLKAGGVDIKQIDATRRNHTKFSL